MQIARPYIVKLILSWNSLKVVQRLQNCLVQQQTSKVELIKRRNRHIIEYGSQSKEPIPYICHFFYTGKIFGEWNLHSKLPIFRVKSVKIYTGQKKFTRAPPVAPVTNMRYAGMPKGRKSIWTTNPLFEEKIYQITYYLKGQSQKPLALNDNRNEWKQKERDLGFQNCSKLLKPAP